MSKVLTEMIHLALLGWCATAFVLYVSEHVLQWESMFLTWICIWVCGSRYHHYTPRFYWYEVVGGILISINSYLCYSFCQTHSLMSFALFHLVSNLVSGDCHGTWYWYWCCHRGPPLQITHLTFSWHLHCMAIFNQDQQQSTVWTVNIHGLHSTNQCFWLSFIIISFPCLQSTFMVPRVVD